MPFYQIYIHIPWEWKSSWLKLDFLLKRLQLPKESNLNAKDCRCRFMTKINYVKLCQQTIKVHQGCNYGSATSMRISKLITKKQSRKPQFVYLLIKRELNLRNTFALTRKKYCSIILRMKMVYKWFKKFWQGCSHVFEWVQGDYFYACPFVYLRFQKIEDSITVFFSSTGNVLVLS